MVLKPATIVAVDQLTETTIAEMLAMMPLVYTPVDPQEFRSDLAAKQEVILLYDQEDQLRGFSTLQFRTLTMPDRPPCSVVFSGDTVIHPEAWGSNRLGQVWVERCLRHAADPSGKPTYWLLLSKGPRTFRYLTLFFREWWNLADGRAPTWVGDLCTQFLQPRYGALFDASKGVVHAPRRAYHLRTEQLPAEEDARPDVQHFRTLNPGFAQGDELVCLAPIFAGNFRPTISRLGITIP